MQDLILNDSPVKPSSCAAQLCGATYYLRMDMRDGCLEATVKKRSLSSQVRTADLRQPMKAECLWLQSCYESNHPAGVDDGCVFHYGGLDLATKLTGKS